MEAMLLLVAVVVLASCLILPIVAIVRTGRIRSLELRIAALEAASRLPVEVPPPMWPQAPIPEPAALAVTPPPAPPPITADRPVQRPVERHTEHLEQVIGRKWLGLIAMALIFCAAVFFLKYAFENRWIGELGRVTLELTTGLALVWGGHQRHRKGWRYLSQILIGGGVTILYLAVYGAFGYYHLIPPRDAFVFLAILVAETHLLALVYDAPSIAVMALVGGFLIPVLVSTGRDQYRVLFTYIGCMDLGVLGLVMARRWRWIASLAYVGTQVLFWLWFGEHYHPEKRLAALAFQTAVFLLFVLADLAPSLRRRSAGWEECLRLVVSPFVLYSTCYYLLDADHHEWMAVLALALAIVYAALARAELNLVPSDRRMLLVTAGTALTFVTLAIPVQLESNWITIAWSIEAVALLWVGLETAGAPLRWLSGAVFSLALFRFLALDTPWESQTPFTPVLNRYFLGTLALVACLGGAAYLYRRWAPVRGFSLRKPLAAGFVAFGVLWLGSSIETYTYFAAQAAALFVTAAPGGLEAVRQLRWAGQLSLSLLWSVFAGLLAAGGFRFRLQPLRVAALALFALTLGKVFLVDMAELRQFYRIVAVLALGLVLLVVAWAYQRGLRGERTE